MSSANAAGSTTDSGSSLPSSSLSHSENKIFKKWRKEFSLLTGYGIDPGERALTINHRSCERWKKDLLNYSKCLVCSFTIFQLLTRHRSANTVHAQTSPAYWCKPHDSSLPLFAVRPHSFRRFLPRRRRSRALPRELPQ